MQYKLFTRYEHFRKNPSVDSIRLFLQGHPNNNFFQSPEFFEFIENVEGYMPFQLVAIHDNGEIAGSLIGVFQSNGVGVKSWLSRRLIVWGGPLVADEKAREAAKLLILEMKKYAAGKAIFAEFRNFFDTSSLQKTFENCGFEYRPHLNYIVKTDEEKAVESRMSSNRKRQIKSSLKIGASIEEPENEEDVKNFYIILEKLYKEKVKKPLPSIDLFLKLWQSNLGKIFLVKYQGRVVGGIMCPIFKDEIIYEWYVCGDDGQEKGLNPSVLATWAPIEYGIKKGFHYFDFMGAGKPDEDYGVRDFKARFGGEEVAYGRYHAILNKALYEIGKLGLKVYQQIK